MADLTTTKGAGDALKKKFEELDGASYESKYAGDIAAAVDKIKNAGEFKYDSTTDAGYQAAKSQYEKSAKKNMKNTMAASTALTGGYINSWGQTAAQQAYDDTMSEAITRLLPQYEQQAYSRHRDGINDNYNQLNMLQGLDATDYGRYADKLAADQAILNLAASMYDSNRGYDRNVFESDRDYGYRERRDAVADAQWRESFDYQMYRDAVADAQWREGLEASKSGSGTTGTGYADVTEPKSLSATEYDRYMNTAYNLEGEKLYKYLEGLYNNYYISESDMVNILLDLGIEDPDAFIKYAGNPQGSGAIDFWQNAAAAARSKAYK